MKQYQEYVIIEDPILIKDYDSVLPRQDQVKAYANKMSKELVALFEVLKTAITTPGNIDPRAISSMCGIIDDFNFVAKNYLHRHEYIRLEYDSFARIIKMNEAKRKYSWFGYIIIKIFLIELLGNYPETMGAKASKSLLL